MSVDVAKAIRLPAFGLTFAALDFILILSTQFYVRGFLISTTMLISSIAYLYYKYKDAKSEIESKMSLKNTAI